MKKHKIILSHEHIIELLAIVDTHISDLVFSTNIQLEEKLLLSVFYEIKHKILTKLILPQARYTISYTPAQATALGIIASYNYADIYQNHVGTKIQLQLPTEYQQ